MWEWQETPPLALLILVDDKFIYLRNIVIYKYSLLPSHL